MYKCICMCTYLQKIVIRVFDIFPWILIDLQVPSKNVIIFLF